jgi:hypothetical protein
MEIDGRNRVSSFNAAGKTVRVGYVDENIATLTIDGEQFSLRSYESDRKIAGVVAVNAFGEPVAVIDALDTRKSAASSLIPGFMEFAGTLSPDGRSAASVRSQHSDWQKRKVLASQAAVNSATLFESHQKGLQKCQDTTSCDAMRDMDFAACDFMFDVELAAGTAMAAALTATGVGAPAAGAWYTAYVIVVAGKRYSCKAQALAAWSACVYSC